jgi:hypothetical protein
MSILNHFQHLSLTSDQLQALEALSDFLNSDRRIFILQGYAGSGKTTLLKGFVEFLITKEQGFELMAPTGRAAKVINLKTGFASYTIHKSIYCFEKLDEIEDKTKKDDVSFLYQFQIKNNPNVHNSILLVDEASMVSDVLSEGEFFRFGSGRLLSDLISYSRVQDVGTTSKLIFIGDPAQLPPIGMSFSPALTSSYLKESYNLEASFTEMKQVKRQDSENGVLISATKIRQCLTSGYFNEFDLRENGRDIFNPSYCDYLETYKSVLGQKIIICWKNKTALELNNGIRNDIFGEDLPIQESDKIIIGKNNYRLGIMNGEFAIVSAVSRSIISRDVKFYNIRGGTESVRLTWRFVTLVLPDDNNSLNSIEGYILENFLYGDSVLEPIEQRALYIDFKNRHPKLKKGTVEFGEAILADQFFNCILLKYGYAITCHKAQGGEWPNTFVFWDRGSKKNFNFYSDQHDSSGKSSSDFYRWAYTSVTRSSEKMYCVNPPYFSTFSGMTFINTKTQKALSQLTGKDIKTIDIDFIDFESDLAKFSLTDKSASIQDHFIYSLHHIKKCGINIHEHKIVEYEIRYTFHKENQSASFKYWINGKGKFNDKFQKIPSLTTSDDLFDEISNIFKNGHKVNVIRNLVKNNSTQIEFDIAIEEEKPFLKTLFDNLSCFLIEGEIITEVMHLEYKERYVINDQNDICVIDFEYDGDGFFGRVYPVKNKCNSDVLLIKIKNFVANLKAGNHVI